MQIQVVRGRDAIWTRDHAVLISNGTTGPCQRHHWLRLDNARIDDDNLFFGQGY